MKKIKKTENCLTIQSPRFYCLKDEDAFFEWIQKIDCIDTFSGIGKELDLHLSADDIHDSNLRDLLGLFHRYNINMQSLSLTIILKVYNF